MKNKQLLYRLFSVCLLLVVVGMFFSPTVSQADGLKQASYECRKCGYNQNKQSQDDLTTHCTNNAECWEATFQGFKNDLSTRSVILSAGFDWWATGIGAHPGYRITNIVATIVTISNKTVKFPTLPPKPMIEIFIFGYESMKIVGLLLVLLYFIIELLDSVQADSFTVEALIKKLLTLAVTIVVLEQGPAMLKYLIYLTDALAIKVAKTPDATIGDVVAEYGRLMNKTKEGAWFPGIEYMIDGLGILIANAIPFLMQLIAVFFVFMNGLGRLMELYIRFMFAPIGMAQLVSGGTKGPGMRYIKKLASSLLQGAVLVASALSAGYIAKSFTGLMGVLMAIIIPFTLIGFLNRTQAIADDIVGVH